MTGNASALRSLIIYALILPLAVVMGYLLGTPLDTTSFSTISLILLLLAVPLLMGYHQILLFATWNMTAVLFFLPGSPPLWMGMSFISLAFSIVQRALNKNMRFLSATPVVLPLIALAAVVLFTAWQTGGLGMRVLGSGAVGGRHYLMIIGGIVGMMAMVAQRIPLGKEKLFMAIHLLGFLTSAIGLLLPLLNKSFYFIFWLFPIQDPWLVSGITSDVLALDPGIERYSGLGAAGMGLSFYIIARYGFRELFRPRNFWLLACFILALGASLSGGFRTVFVLIALTCAFAFYFERLVRTRLFVGLLVFGFTAGAFLIPFANHLPLPVQRALSIIPMLPVDPIARFDAQQSSEWRLRMWATLWPQVPQYLLLGKGYAINLSDLELTQELSRRGLADSSQVAMIAGDYHNGPLSVLIPFGLPGATTFVWFLLAAIWALYSNYRYGDGANQRMNVFLLSAFLARTVLFLFVYGGFYGDIMPLCGIMGFSISLNGGIRRPVRESRATVTENEPRPIGTLAPLGSG
jgi:hypothetical protein